MTQRSKSLASFSLGAMTVGFLLSALLVGCSCPIGVQDCNWGPALPPPISLQVNSSNLPGTVSSSPVTLEAFTLQVPLGQVQFLEGTKVIGQVATGTPTGQANQFSYKATLDVTRADNGPHAYIASVTFKDNAGASQQLTSDPISVTIQLP
jgi:hypothetical protein